MSTPASPSPTHQQLDELDALLQRMLELPVNPLDEDLVITAPPPEPVPTMSPAEKVVAMPLPLVAASALAEQLPAESHRPNLPSPPVAGGEGPGVRGVGASTPSPPAPLPRSGGEGREVLFVSSKPQAAETAAPRDPKPMTPAHSYTPTPSLPHSPRWLRLLIESNRIFDRGMARLGRPGRWLRRPRGRALLGWTGLLFLAAALTLVLLDWIGWTR